MGNQTIHVKGTEIVIFQKRDDDFISLTDIARHKNPESTGLVISHWLSTRYTVEFLGIWEQMHNPIFNVTEFSSIKNQSGSNGFALSGDNPDFNYGEFATIKSQAGLSATP
jgi:hypothetical protein